MIAKVADFGFCGINLTQDAKLRGKSNSWAAPEILLLEQSTNMDSQAFKRSDIYSFGLVAVLIFMGGQSPFDPSVDSAALRIEGRASRYLAMRLRSCLPRKSKLTSLDLDWMLTVSPIILNSTLRREPAERWDTLEHVQSLWLVIHRLYVKKSY